MLCAKNRSKKHLIFEKCEHFHKGQNWPQRVGYSLCKIVSLGQKLKTAKTGKNDCATTLKMLSAKNRSKKHLILDKREHFQNGQNWPRCPCKMISLGQKLKTAKRCTKRLCDNIKNVVWKKPLQKAPNIRKMRAF